MIPRVAYGATSLKEGRYRRPGKAGSSVSRDKTRFAANAAAKELHHG